MDQTILDQYIQNALISLNCKKVPFPNSRSVLFYEITPLHLADFSGNFTLSVCNQEATFLYIISLPAEGDPQRAIDRYRAICPNVHFQQQDQDILASLSFRIPTAGEYETMDLLSSQSSLFINELNDVFLEDLF